MKANEAPDKIYLTSTENGTNYYTEGMPSERESIEYVRTDAFIEKACGYILSNIPDMHILGESCRMDERIINDFKKYMKGE